MIKFQQSCLLNSSIYRPFSSQYFSTQIPTQEHVWVKVVDPRNKRSLLQACDDCGIVKSENSIARNCRAEPGQGMISAAKELM